MKTQETWTNQKIILQKENQIQSLTNQLKNLKKENDYLRSENNQFLAASLSEFFTYDN